MFRCRTFRIGVGPDFAAQEREVCVVVACEKKKTADVLSFHFVSVSISDNLCSCDSLNNACLPPCVI